MKTLSLSVTAALLLTTCGDSRRPGDSDGDLPGIGDVPVDDDDDDDDDDDEGSDEGEYLDLGDVEDDTGSAQPDDPDADDDCEEGELPDPNALLTGTVFAPNMEIPISGALVYVTDEPVEPIPDGVYCAECVDVTCKHHVLTEYDGTFELPAGSGDNQQLVVQKGEFLHVVDIDIEPGSQVIDPEDSNLPGEWNPDEGQWIPRIAVYETSPDEVFNVLAKFGLGDVDAGGSLVPGSERFALINAESDQGASMDDLDEMNKYHIMFVPCAATKQWPGAPMVPEARADNIRAYVEAGGKWYATDHSNEYLKEPFPAYQDFHNPGMPDLQPPFDSQAEVIDEHLLGWLEALPNELKDIGGGNPTLFDLPMINTMLNYSGIDEIHDIWVEDDEGMPVNVGHHTWVEGPCASCSPSDSIRPMAVSGQYGCGRMMYSTFENSSEAHDGLNPQELVLLYMILEISVCHDEPPPPPPPPPQ
ncbi:MAG: hypothetical protein B7733_21450 [Myxococcales bacterium FL481]|nr:MAG: hypothetical protein B7733_21450 [Myxococcales bacterium FL481]